MIIDSQLQPHTPADGAVNDSDQDAWLCARSPREVTWTWPRNRKRSRAFGVLAGVVLAVIGLACAAALAFVKPAHTGGLLQSGPVGSSELIVATEDPELTCIRNGRDCSEAKCCSMPGMQCYKKNKEWASCNETCDSETKDDMGDTWNCDKIGARQCAREGQPCAESQCCSDPGMQCYRKNKYWSGCMETCSKKPDAKGEVWDCRKIGNRSSFGFTLGCSWAGEDCSTSKYCCQQGLSCYKKDETFASCSEKAPEGWDGTVLGGSRKGGWDWRKGDWKKGGVVHGIEEAGREVLPAVKGADVLGTSLFCLMAVLSGSYEEELVELQKGKRASIFGCEKHAVFKAWESKKTVQGSWVSVKNTGVFLKLWEWVYKNDLHLQCDWTVKVDPDTVFMPSRLRTYLAGLRVHADMPIYVKNSWRSFGFLGAIEIFTKSALSLYYQHGEGCNGAMGTTGGEDFYFKACLDALGASYMYKDEILSSMDDTYFCNQADAVAFHPFKDASIWGHCYSTMTGMMQPRWAKDLGDTPFHLRKKDPVE